MKKVHVKKCSSCNGTFKSVTSHLLRSKKCSVSTNNITLHKKSNIYKSRTSSQKYHLSSNHLDIFEELNKNYSINKKKSSLNEFNDVDMAPIDVSDDMYCDDLLFQEKSLNNNKNAIIDEQIVFLSQLIKLLNDTNSPLNLYDKIMKWAVHSVKNGFQFAKGFPSRQKVVTEMSNVCCLNGLAPRQKPLKLTNNRQTLVNYFDFEQQCFSILSNPDLMSDENLSFPNDNPCHYSRVNKNVLNCIEDGQLFQDTAASVCKYPNDFCLGIKLFIDATHTDVHSNWMLDPVMFTFTFFKNEVTQSDNAWRTLGLITDTDQNSKAQNSRILTHHKLQDFHLQLEVIFESFKNVKIREDLCGI